MKIEEKIQGKESEYNIFDDMSKMLKNKKLKQVYIMAGIIKDEAFNLLKEDFNYAKENGVDINYIIGVDRKTTTENLLKDILQISDKSYMYSNNQDETYNAKIYIFVFDKKVEIILPSTNLTANGITNNYSNVTSITYELTKDEKEYNDFMFSIKEYIYPDKDVFTLINEKSIREFSIAREFAVAKVSDLKLPSISDYLKITNEGKKIPDEKEIEEKIQSKIKGIVKNFDVLLEDDNILIEEDNSVIEEKKEEVKEKPKKVVVRKKE